MTSPSEHPPDEVPTSWQELLDLELSGVVMIVGAPDSGKTTLARFLYSRIADRDRSGIAYLDADPGQSSIGPPTTLSLGISEEEADSFPPRGQVRRWFVGCTSPSGHMLPHLSGLVRLTQVARESDAGTVIVDTCGLVEPRQGGHVLKTAEIDLLLPSSILALQRKAELEGFLEPQRRAANVSIHDVEVPDGVRRRSSVTRARNRTRRYRQHFHRRRRHEIDPGDWPIIPPGPLDPDRLVGLCDTEGFALALAVVETGTSDGPVTLTTPLESLDAVSGLRLGNVLLDLETYRDRLEQLPFP